MRLTLLLATLLVAVACQTAPPATPDPSSPADGDARASDTADLVVSDMLPEAIRRGAWLASGQQTLADLWSESVPNTRAPLLEDPAAQAAVAHFGGISPCAEVEVLNIDTTATRVVIDTRVHESASACDDAEAFWTIVIEVPQDQSLPADALVEVTESGTVICDSEDPSNCEVPLRP